MERVAGRAHSTVVLSPLGHVLSHYQAPSSLSTAGGGSGWTGARLTGVPVWEPSPTPSLIRVFLCPRLRIERTAAALLALSQPGADLVEPLGCGAGSAYKKRCEALAPPAYTLVGPSPAVLHRLLPAHGG